MCGVLRIAWNRKKVDQKMFQIFGPVTDTCAKKFLLVSMGAEQRDYRVQTQERGPPSALVEIFVNQSIRRRHASICIDPELDSQLIRSGCRCYTVFRTKHINTIMSLAHLLTGLLDQHGDTVQQAALLAYLKQGEDAQPYLEVT